MFWFGLDPEACKERLFVLLFSWSKRYCLWPGAMRRGCMQVHAHSLSMAMRSLQKGAADTASSACKQLPLATPPLALLAASVGGLQSLLAGGGCTWLPAFGQCSPPHRLPTALAVSVGAPLLTTAMGTSHSCIWPKTSVCLYFLDRPSYNIYPRNMFWFEF